MGKNLDKGFEIAMNVHQVFGRDKVLLPLDTAIASVGISSDDFARRHCVSWENFEEKGLGSVKVAALETGNGVQFLAECYLSGIPDEITISVSSSLRNAMVLSEILSSLDVQKHEIIWTFQDESEEGWVD